MDLPRYSKMMEYHNDNPPIHQLVARYLGVGRSKGDNEPRPMNEEDVQELMKNFPKTPGML